jgi:anti-sigma regulatory factor (Ser/Thr protein kinase)
VNEISENNKQKKDLIPQSRRSNSETGEDLAGGMVKVIPAVSDNLPLVLDFVNENLEKKNCPPRMMMQINIAVEEVFVNIALYAYDQTIGTAKICAKYLQDEDAIVLTFIDSGKPFDPLAKADPDVTLSAEERKIGGLGIFMTKKIMDECSYEYRDGQNVLTMKKKLS